MKIDAKIVYPEDLKKTIAVIIGTRPGIVMFAPIIKELRKKGVPHFIIHTGQHYSPNMDAQFFEDLNLPQPDYKIKNVAEKTTHGAQTAVMLEGIEKILMAEKPVLTLVGGDANTNLAGALAARKIGTKVAHIEAGERSFDWRMPEEHNRRIIDHISEYLFASGQKAKGQLESEAVQGKIFVVGNPIVDASVQHFGIASAKSQALSEMNLNPNQYALLTTHREENVDFPNLLENILEGVSRSGRRLNLPVVFLAHPRTLKRLIEFGLMKWAQTLPGMRIHEALGYLDFLNLVGHSRIVFTDSGGVQQEACINQVPAVTLRENTEWTETLLHGANRLAGTEPLRIESAALDALNLKRKWPVPFGDGNAARRIVEVCCQVINEIQGKG